MAHFAEVDAGNNVLRVLVVSDSEQHRGQQYLAVDLQLGGTWIQTSYNNNLRKQFAAVGGSYDPVADVFIAPQPFSSWVLDANHDWQAQVPMPSSVPVGKVGFVWDEVTLAWVAV